MADSQEAGMTELPVHSPLDEGNLHNDLRAHPMRSHLRQSDGLRERRFRNLERIEPGAQLQQQLRIESGPDLSREDELVPLEVPDEQGAETDTSALRVRKS